MVFYRVEVVQTEVLAAYNLRETDIVTLNVCYVPKDYFLVSVGPEVHLYFSLRVHEL